MSIFTWLVVGVIIFSVIAYANPQLWEDVRDKAIQSKDIVVSKAESIKTEGVIEPAKKTDTLESKCKRSFDDCKDIFYKKHGLPISISEIKETDNVDESYEFYNIWLDRLDDWDKWDKEFRLERLNEVGFPQVLIAFSVSFPSKKKVPHIAMCGEDGELTEYSKEILSC